MPLQPVNLEENSLKCLGMIRSELDKPIDSHVLLNSCIAFTAFIFHCAQENELFKENLNNVMGTDDFRKFLTSENNTG